jgi:predicted RNA-binding protein YlxR (DUF448 family)
VRYGLREGTAVPDPRRRLPGRGAYVCAEPACIERATARRAFARAFRAPVQSVTAK